MTLDEKRPKASIVIRAKNSAGSIGKVLSSVFAQDFKDFEVIVVDSGSTDGTLEILSQHPVRLLTIPPESFTYGYSLNVGTEKARGEFAVYLSDHALPANSRWLGALIAPFADPRVAGVFGRHLPYPHHNPVEARHVERAYPNVRKAEWDANAFSCTNGAIRWGLWETIRFDEISAEEDAIWAAEAQGHGFSIVYEPEAAVYHSHNSDLRSYYRFTVAVVADSYRAGTTRQRGLLRLSAACMKSYLKDVVYLLRGRRHPKWLAYALAYEAVMFWANYVARGSQVPRGSRGEAQRG